MGCGLSRCGSDRRLERLGRGGYVAPGRKGRVCRFGSSWVGERRNASGSGAWLGSESLHGAVRCVASTMPQLSKSTKSERLFWPKSAKLLDSVFRTLPVVRNRLSHGGKNARMVRKVWRETRERLEWLKTPADATARRCQYCGVPHVIESSDAQCSRTPGGPADPARRRLRPWTGHDLGSRPLGRSPAVGAGVFGSLRSGDDCIQRRSVPPGAPMRAARCSCGPRPRATC